MLSLEEVKGYLRVDGDHEDGLIENLMDSATALCLEVSRCETSDQLAVYPHAELALLYTIAYFYEHREEADHRELTLTLRALLFGVRQEGF